jgi:hypothetical protein
MRLNQQTYRNVSLTPRQNIPHRVGRSWHLRGMLKNTYSNVYSLLMHFGDPVPVAL